MQKLFHMTLVCMKGKCKKLLSLCVYVCVNVCVYVCWFLELKKTWLIDHSRNFMQNLRLCL